MYKIINKISRVIVLGILCLLLSFTVLPSQTIEANSFDNLKEGDRDERLISIKQKLNWLTYDGINVNDYFGSWTNTRVRQFQDEQDLTVDGIIGPMTYNQLNETFDSVFITNSVNHPGVVKMKENLTTAGFGGMNINDIFGSFTSHQVESFQEYYNLNEENGNGTLETLNYLEDLQNSPFQEGGEHPEVVEIKEMLNELGYDGIAVNEIYGSWTATRVSQFQRDFGLVENGIVDEPTHQKLTEFYNTNLESGDESEQLIPIKQKLNWLTYDGINVNETFGGWTETRVKQFQSDYGLESNGEINHLTLSKLDEVFRDAFKPGGINHSGVIKMKERLTEVGFGGMNINNIYGSFTSQQVESFQAYYNLDDVNGVATLETLNYLENLVNSPFQVDGEHPEVVEIKNMLTVLGYGGMNINEIYGSWTATRVSQFQRDHGLKSNGIVDEPTHSKLVEVTDNILKQGDTSDRLIPIKQKLNWLNYDGINVNESFGSWTETRVKQFQSDYGLHTHGMLDELTVNKISEVFNGVFSVGGKTSSGVTRMKEMLTEVGFGGMNINDIYGSYTSSQVRSYQEYYGLDVVNGEATLETLNSLEDLVDSPFQEGRSHSDVVELKEGLIRLDFGGMNVNKTFGSWTSTRVSQFQSHFNLVSNGIADQPTWDKLNQILDSPYQQGKSDPFIVEIKQMLINLGYGGMNINENFGSWTETRVLQFQEDYNLPESGIVDEVTLSVLMDEANRVIYSNYDVSFDRAVDIQLSQGTPKYDGAGAIDADEANVSYYMNPSNFPEGSSGYLQFLLLDESTNLPASELNNSFLSNAGTLNGTGEAFIEAGEEYGLNELYLIAHALHETSRGTSTLASGVGVDGSGNVIREDGDVVREEDHSDVEHIVYNMYGYGAHDDNPTNGGAEYAFNRDWFSPEAAVIGGAEQISNQYINRGQNTLFKMKWDPEYIADENSLGKQYATHVRWAEIQANMIYSMLGDNINDYSLNYDVPSYNNQPGPDGSVPPPPENTQDPGDYVEQTYPSGVIGEVQVSNNLNFREGPSTGYDRIGGISDGTNIDILGDNGENWLYIEYNGDKGWVSKTYVEILNLYVVDSGNGITVRDNPAGNSVGALPNNELVVLSLDSNQNIVSEDKVLGSTNYTWYRIYYNGNERWTANNWLEKIE